MSQTETTTAEDHRPAGTFTIKVNDSPVTLTDHHQTGASIKAAAIAAGVPIQPDFDLSEVLPNGKQKPIANDKPVEVKEGDEFWAIPGDDNS
jgi:Multiubiquitin